jgi:uncharacterized cupin superfamily protein
MAEPATNDYRAIDAWSLEPRIGAPYPAPYADICAAREKRALGDAFGLTNFGVNLTRLPPGCASAQRHWHTRQDELVYVLEGEVVLVTDGGEQVLTPGMTAGFPAGVTNGHMLVNRSLRDAVYLEVGDRTPDDEVEYPDVDMAIRLIDGKRRRVRKDGTGV